MKVIKCVKCSKEAWGNNFRYYMFHEYEGGRHPHCKACELKHLGLICAACEKRLDRSCFHKDRWDDEHPRCKECRPRGFTIIGEPSLDQAMLDKISARPHPNASNQTRQLLMTVTHTACTDFPLKEKKFCGRDRVSVLYKQVAHGRYLMKNLTGLAPQLEGQYFKPVITWMAGTITITSAMFRGFATYVSPNMLKGDIISRGYYLKKEKASAVALFRSGAPGMYMISCPLKNEYDHYIGYDGLRGVIYEPLGNELVALDGKDLEDTKIGIHPIHRLREKLSIKCFGQVHQLWKQKEYHVNYLVPFMSQ